MLNSEAWDEFVAEEIAEKNCPGFVLGNGKSFKPLYDQIKAIEKKSQM